MRKLINIRGAVGTGKTTAVRQFMEREGFAVEQLEMGGWSFPLSVTNDRRFIALGDYKAERNCTGCDSVSRDNGESIGKRDIARAVMLVCARYSPDAIIYEQMIGSQLFQSTKEVADVGRTLGYEYKGVQLMRSESERMRLLEKRSGARAKTKNFHKNAKRVNRATEMLNEGGYEVRVVDADKIPLQEMWGVVANALG